MIDDLFDVPPKARRAAPEEIFPLADHPGIPWAMWTRQAINALWRHHRVTTYSAAKLPLSAAQACAIFGDDSNVAPKIAGARLDQLVSEFRQRRGF